MSGQRKKILIIAVAAVVLASALACAWLSAAPRGAAGAKAIGLTVVYADGSSDEFSFSTDAEYLRQALEEQRLLGGEESEYGLFVQTVNGVTADEALQQWWYLSRNGEESLTGVDQTPLADGDHFELTLKTGW